MLRHFGLPDYDGVVEFFRRAAVRPSRLGILPGSFNPPTRAHVALARAALGVTDEVLFVLPRRFPHKNYEGASFEERVRMLEAIARNEERFSIGTTEGGLFIDVARACRAEYPLGTRLSVVCGSDAADRIVNWDYGEPGAFLRMLEEFELLVADRNARYEPPPAMKSRIHALPLEAEHREVSATEIRNRLLRGEDWSHLVPEEIAGMVPAIFGRVRA